MFKSVIDKYDDIIKSLYKINKFNDIYKSLHNIMVDFKYKFESLNILQLKYPPDIIKSINDLQIAFKTIDIFINENKFNKPVLHNLFDLDGAIKYRDQYVIYVNNITTTLLILIDHNKSYLSFVKANHNILDLEINNLNDLKLCEISKNIDNIELKLYRPNLNILSSNKCNVCNCDNFCKHLQIMQAYKLSECARIIQNDIDIKLFEDFLVMCDTIIYQLREYIDIFNIYENDKINKPLKLKHKRIKKIYPLNEKDNIVELDDSFNLLFDE